MVSTILHQSTITEYRHYPCEKHIILAWKLQPKITLLTINLVKYVTMLSTYNRKNILAVLYFATRLGTSCLLRFREEVFRLATTYLKMKTLWQRI